MYQGYIYTFPERVIEREIEKERGKEINKEKERLGVRITFINHDLTPRSTFSVFSHRINSVIS